MKILLIVTTTALLTLVITLNIAGRVNTPEVIEEYILTLKEVKQHQAANLKLHRELRNTQAILIKQLTDKLMETHYIEMLWNDETEKYDRRYRKRKK